MMGEPLPVWIAIVIVGIPAIGVVCYLFGHAKGYDKGWRTRDRLPRVDLSSGLGNRLVVDAIESRAEDTAATDLLVEDVVRFRMLAESSTPDKYQMRRCTLCDGEYLERPGHVRGLCGSCKKRMADRETLEEKQARILQTIRAIEGWEGPGTVGDAGERGPYHITEAYYEDAVQQDDGIALLENERGFIFVMDSLECEEISRRVVAAYMERYCPEAWAFELGDESLEYISRTHNGGPEGPWKISTEDYHRKFLAKWEELTR